MALERAKARSNQGVSSLGAFVTFTVLFMFVTSFTAQADEHCSERLSPFASYLSEPSGDPYTARRHMERRVQSYLENRVRFQGGFSLDESTRLPDRDFLRVVEKIGLNTQSLRALKRIEHPLWQSSVFEAYKNWKINFLKEEDPEYWTGHQVTPLQQSIQEEINCLSRIISELESHKPNLLLNSEQFRDWIERLLPESFHSIEDQSVYVEAIRKEAKASGWIELLSPSDFAENAGLEVLVMEIRQGTEVGLDGGAILTDRIHVSMGRLGRFDLDRNEFYLQTEEDWGVIGRRTEVGTVNWEGPGRNRQRTFVWVKKP